MASKRVLLQAELLPFPAPTPPLTEKSATFAFYFLSSFL